MSGNLLLNWVVLTYKYQVFTTRMSRCNLVKSNTGTGDDQVGHRYWDSISSSCSMGLRQIIFILFISLFGKWVYLQPFFFERQYVFLYSCFLKENYFAVSNVLNRMEMVPKQREQLFTIFMRSRGRALGMIISLAQLQIFCHW